MEHDDSGRTRFLPHIFSPDMGHLVSDHSDNVVDPTVQHKTPSLNVTLSHDKRFYHVEKCKMSHPLALPIRFAEARLSGIVSQVPHGKFCCAFIHSPSGCQIGTRDLRIPCWSLKCEAAPLVFVKIYVILHGLMWNVYAPERPLGQHVIKCRLQQQDMEPVI